MHQVERAIFDIRRGLPIVLQSQAGEYVLVQPLEDVTESQLHDLVTLAGEAPGLVLSRHRLALLQSSEDAEPGRLPLTMAAARNRHYLYELAVGADISVSAVNERSSTATASAEPASQADRTALALMRQALLIPAALTAHVPAAQRAVVDARIADGTLLAVPVEQAARCADASGGRLKRVSEARVPLAESPDSRFILFREADGLREHVAVLIGQPTSWSSVVPLRLHSACLTGDLFGSLRCDCGEQLRNAVADIHAMGGGVLLYLAQEGRGIGLGNKLRAYALQDIGHDTVDADQILGFGDDERGYQVAVDILNQLAIQRVQLLTNNPLKMAALSEAGIEVIGRQAVYGRLTDHNHRYLSTKADRGGHWLDDVFSG